MQNICSFTFQRFLQALSPQPESSCFEKTKSQSSKETQPTRSKQAGGKKGRENSPTPKLLFSPTFYRSPLSTINKKPVWFGAGAACLSWNCVARQCHARCNTTSQNSWARGYVRDRKRKPQSTRRGGGRRSSKRWHWNNSQLFCGSKCRLADGMLEI